MLGGFGQKTELLGQEPGGSSAEFQVKRLGAYFEEMGKHQVGVGLHLGDKAEAEVADLGGVDVRVDLFCLAY